MQSMGSPVEQGKQELIHGGVCVCPKKSRHAMWLPTVGRQEQDEGRRRDPSVHFYMAGV